MKEGFAIELLLYNFVEYIIEHCISLVFVPFQQALLKNPPATGLSRPPGMTVRHLTISKGYLACNDLFSPHLQTQVPRYCLLPQGLLL